MTPYNNDIFLMGQRNMMCIVRKQGKEFNTLLYSYVGIKNERVVNILQFLFPFIFVLNVLFSLLVTIIKFILSLFRTICKSEYVEKEYDELFLNFTYMFLERVKAAGLYNESKYWIIGPNIEQTFIPKDKIIVDYKNAIALRDNFTILRNSMNTIWNYLWHEHSLCLVHKVWQFYEVQVALTKITKKSKIYFANQSDKYANLLDSIPSGPKVLLQHGIALNWDKLPCPLKNIDTFYAISDKTWQDAFSNILIGSPSLKFFNPTIHMTEFKSDKKKVLIVSEVTYFEQEVEMLKALKNIDVDVYLKRHPGFTQDECYRNLLQDFSFTYITERTFPKVDFVISYFSTLAFEYMAWNIPVYIYNTKEEYDNEVMLFELNRALKCKIN